MSVARSGERLGWVRDAHYGVFAEDDFAWGDGSGGEAAVAFVWDGGDGEGKVISWVGGGHAVGFRVAFEPGGEGTRLSWRPLCIPGNGGRDRPRDSNVKSAMP